ncbi:MAG TPA: class I SAM-dependent RNA methyltransferase [Candidatus Gemmiger excrementipullorum]|uniref:Class I SAM-dependent RNA methyltransferase n=1 Tax=Candidatus Gemmiger excrementipullorum TaxID=2838610 RepID=A0A9D1XYV9_9FIRM|nr:class I SAM-dependent RNA methyltransferase [Candidatus Gemmiger excrementipullorum]
MPAMYTLVAPCFFGTESTLHFEIKRLGAQNIQVTDGRIAFQGGAELIAAANLNLRTAERVLLQLARYKATTFDELFDGCYQIPWEELLPADAAFPVKGSSLSSQLSSVPACQSILKKAVVKRLLAGHRVTALPESGDVYKIRFALRKDEVEIYLDTSGDGLHKRGYRKRATLAPIKETLAAAIADLGRVRRDSLVQDPFCGSGTLVIEAAQKALNLAPGLGRHFAAEHFAFLPAEIWAQQREKARGEARPDAAFEGVGYDIDPAAVALASANARLAGVGDRCRFAVADIKDFTPAANATVLTNPPYGERLGDAAEAAALARTLGQVWQRHPGQGMYAITADAEFEQHFGKKAARRRKIYNGMIPCQLYMYYEQPKR